MKLSWHVIGYGLLALTLGGVVLAYESARRDQIHSEAVQAAQNDFQKQLTVQVADLQKQMSERETQYKQDTLNLQRQFQGSMQQVLAIVQAKAGLPVPLQVVTPAPTAANPNPQPTVVVPSVDLPQAKAYVQACEQCKLDLAKVQADVADRAKQAALAQQEIDSLKTERDVAIKASKGGNWMRRAVHNGKVAAIGGGIAVVVVCALGHCR